ncbi:Methylamine utilization protein MauE [Bacillus sp. IT-79MI2]|uniref:MauE/DoxX family redox-associated membrane protein n=1 Tax=Bacillus sp. IT-79MI2 TaxID=3026438 RepID=UPI0039DF76C8
MAELIFFLRIIIGTVLISAAFDHIQNFNEYKLTIRNYKMIPIYLEKTISLINIGLELLIGTMIIMGFHQVLAFSSGGILFGFYAIIISLSIVMERNNITCGCGGILGNHEVNWKLVVRNVLFAGVCLYMSYKVNYYSNMDGFILIGFKTFNYNSLLIVVVATSTLLIYTIFTNILSIKQKLNELCQ